MGRDHPEADGLVTLPYSIFILFLSLIKAQVPDAQIPPLQLALEGDQIPPLQLALEGEDLIHNADQLFYRKFLKDPIKEIPYHAETTGQNAFKFSLNKRDRIAV